MVSDSVVSERSDVVDSRRLKDLVLWRAYAPEPKGGWPKQLAQKARAASRNEEEQNKLEAP